MIFGGLEGGFVGNHSFSIVFVPPGVDLLKTIGFVMFFGLQSGWFWVRLLKNVEGFSSRRAPTVIFGRLEGGFVENHVFF